MKIIKGKGGEGRRAPPKYCFYSTPMPMLLSGNAILFGLFRI
jgi:hypothetical protein